MFIGICYLFICSYMKIIEKRRLYIKEDKERRKESEKEKILSVLILLFFSINSV